MKTSILALAVILTLLAPVAAFAQTPAPAETPVAATPCPARLDMPPVQIGGTTVNQNYIDVLSYYYQQSVPKDQDWNLALKDALNPAGAACGGFAHVVLIGVPAEVWWIDCWHLELDGTWKNTADGYGFHVVGQAPNPVHGNMSLQGTLPEAYIMRICDRSGAMLGGWKLFVVTAKAGEAEQAFDVAALPVPPDAQLALLGM